jgi:hypothetical protein
VLPEGNTDSNLVINPDFGGKMESLEHRALTTSELNQETTDPKTDNKSRTVYNTPATDSY